MEATTSFLKTAGVLLGLWLVLFVVGFAIGVIPPEGGWLPGRPAAAPTVTEVEPDASIVDAAAPDAGTAVVELDAASEPATEPMVDPVTPTVTLATHAVCPEPATAPSLAVLNVIGPASGAGARPELVVGCGDAWHVLATGADVPSRIARIVTPAGNAGLSPFVAAPVSLDFDADGRPDLALPFVRYGAGGATSGGGLYVLRQSGWNVLGEVRALAPVAAAAVATGSIDGTAGDDLVAVNQANPFARLPSEGWVFSGGASPRRSSVLRAGTGGRAVALLDLDLDGQLDAALASTDDGRLDVFFGDGTGGFPRRRNFDVPSAAGVSTGDLDGDGHADLIVEGATPAFVIAGPEAALAVTPLAELGALRGIEAIDLDGDGKVEIVGFTPPHLTALHRLEAGTYEARTLVELADPSFGVRRQALVDLDGDGAREIVVLGTRTEGEGRALELLIVPSTERGVVALSSGAPVADAPLLVEVPLPEAQPL